MSDLPRDHPQRLADDHNICVCLSSYGTPQRWRWSTPHSHSHDSETYGSYKEAAAAALAAITIEGDKETPNG